MEPVKQFVKEAMPSLNGDQINAVLARLMELGVTSVEDLVDVQASDLENTLTVIQCRRLVRIVRASQDGSQAATSSTSPVPQPERDMPVLPPTSPESTTSDRAVSASCQTYTVPWDKMPPTIMSSFTSKKWVPTKKRHDMIRLVVDDYISKHHGQRPSRAQLREVAKQIIDKYPLSFQETEPFGNKPFASNGCAVLFQQLENRVENLKRDPTSNMRAPESETPRRKRSRYSDRYGCVEWQPAVEGPEIRTALQLKKEELKNAFRTNDHHQESSVRKLMRETYPIQREAINQGTCVMVLKEDWPFLFESTHLFDHASQLLGFPLMDKLAEELSSKATGIKNFLDSKGMKLGDGPVFLIKGIARYLKEEPDYFLLHNEDSSDVELSTLPCAPCILLRGDHHFKIAVDQVVVNDHITSPVAALAYAFSLFYICNIEYPKEMAQTLEFMQRVFFGINPDRGTKAEQQGKRRHIPAKLAKFVSHLKDFEWSI